MPAPESARPVPVVARVSMSPRAISAVAAAWLVSLAVDLLLHGGLLAKLYFEPGPFLLDAQEAFRRIPLGYLAFLMLTLALYWLVVRLGVRGAAAGFRLGAVAGAVVWGALVLGLLSISTASVPLLAGWWLGQSLELGVAGAVLGAAAAGVPLKRIWLRVAMVVVACFAVTVVLQSIGWAPAVRAGAQAAGAARGSAAVPAPPPTLRFVMASGFRAEPPDRP